MTGSPWLLGGGNLHESGSDPPVHAILPGCSADHYDRHRLLIATQVMAMVQAGLIAALVLTNVIAVWHLIASEPVSRDRECL